MAMEFLWFALVPYGTSWQAYPMGDGRFCETDLPLQQLVQETQLAANVVQTHLWQRIVLIFVPPHLDGFLVCPEGIEPLTLSLEG